MMLLTLMNEKGEFLSVTPANQLTVSKFPFHWNVRLLQASKNRYYIYNKEKYLCMTEVQRRMSLCQKPQPWVITVRGNKLSVKNEKYNLVLYKVTARLIEFVPETTLPQPDYMPDGNHPLFALKSTLHNLKLAILRLCEDMSKKNVEIAKLDAMYFRYQDVREEYNELLQDYKKGILRARVGYFEEKIKKYHKRLQTCILKANTLKVLSDRNKTFRHLFRQKPMLGDATAPREQRRGFSQSDKVDRIMETISNVRVEEIKDVETASRTNVQLSSILQNLVFNEKKEEEKYRDKVHRGRELQKQLLTLVSELAKLQQKVDKDARGEIRTKFYEKNSLTEKLAICQNNLKVMEEERNQFKKRLPRRK